MIGDPERSIAVCGHAVDGGIQIGDVGLLRVGHDHKIVYQGRFPVPSAE